MIAAAGITSSLGVRAQRVRPRRIGYMGSRSPTEAEPRAVRDAFLSEMRRRGWIEGETVEYDFRYADGKPALFAIFAREFVASKVDLIVAMGTTAAIAAKKATSVIPVAFLASDSVEYGLVKSLAYPGENLTGMSLAIGALMGKRVELLTKAVTGISKIAYLGVGEKSAHELVSAAAKSMGREVNLIDAIPDGKTLDLSRAIADGARADAWLVDEYSTFSPHRAQVIGLIAAQHKPAMFSGLSWAREGGLLAYAEDLVAMFVGVAAYADRILRGAKPADLPAEEPREFVLAVNLRTARSLDITIQKALLLQANEVIE